MLRFVPATHDDLAPSGAKARFHANVAAIETARLLAAQERLATADEQQMLIGSLQQQVMNNRIDLYKVLGGGLLEQTGVPSTTATGGSVPVAAPAGSSAN